MLVIGCGFYLWRPRTSKYPAVFMYIYTKYKYIYFPAVVRKQRSKGKGMMDLGAMVGGRDSQSQHLQAFGSAYGLLADVATTLCPADILSLVRGRQRDRETDG